MTLRLYNTLTRRKEEFRPLDPGNVRMYVCGPTVYDFAHIGNARPAVVFDMLFRLLRHIYGADHVTYARNITDVDDKINARAGRDYPDLPLNEAIGRVTEATERQFHADVKALDCLPPTVEPRATQHIGDMKAMIERLVDKDCAYVAEDHVLFHVAALPGYGVLANRSLDEMMAGARVDVAPYKRDPMDFVLWKPSKPGEPAWPSPSGIATPGRPGWHIECSAMAWKHLGETFDIHGGGIDLLFPHHENELAQSRCALGVERMAQVWMHNGFLQVEGRKMAKSEGKFVTINELLREWPGEVIRLAMLMTHYREPMNWTYSQLEQARQELSHWSGSQAFSVEAHMVALERKRGTFHFEVPNEFLAALSDDLNTPAALTVVRSFASGRRQDSGTLRQIYLMAEFLGLLRWNRLGIHLGPVFGGAVIPRVVELSRSLQAALANGLDARVAELKTEMEQSGCSIKIHSDGWLSIDSINTSRDVELQRLIDARTAARRAKNYREADRIRGELEQMGIVVKDNPDGTTWEVKR